MDWRYGYAWYIWTVIFESYIEGIFMDIALELKKTLENVIESQSPVTVDDIRKSTIDMLKVRIEAYKDMLIEIREKELSKSEKPKGDGASNNCATCAGSGKSPFGKYQGKCSTCQGTGEKSYRVKEGNGHPIKKEEFIDRNNEAIPGKRLKEAHNPAGVLPGDKKSKVIESDGSGEVTKGKLGKSIFPENKNGEDPLTLGKASVPMAKPSGGGTGLTPKAPPMSKPAPAIPSVPKPMASPKPPSAPTMKSEKDSLEKKSAECRCTNNFTCAYCLKNAKPGHFTSTKATHAIAAASDKSKEVKKDETMLSSTKQTGAAKQLEPKNTITDDKAGSKGEPATTSSQVGTPGKAGPVAPLFESGRTHGTTDVFEPKKGTLASIIKGASMAKGELEKATMSNAKMMATQANHDAHKAYKANPPPIIPQGKTIKRPTTDYTDHMAPGKFTGK